MALGHPVIFLPNFLLYWHMTSLWLSHETQLSSWMLYVNDNFVNFTADFVSVNTKVFPPLSRLRLEASVFSMRWCKNTKICFQTRKLPLLPHLCCHILQISFIQKCLTLATNLTAVSEISAVLLLQRKDTFTWEKRNVWTNKEQRGVKRCQYHNLLYLPPLGQQGQRQPMLAISRAICPYAGANECSDKSWIQ